ncbi:hypothetical protein SSX86_019798 [Deinandra increscens subsp. villosa]|uniref:SWIM-type domain-containing protein n=1 Tax=Deinandra increscens subsp. villosa TaxID=3103831 RepID=A0AAP0GXL0_9ASTR
MENLSDNSFEDAYVHKVVGIEVTSPNSSTKHYIPDVPEKCKPYEGTLFGSLEHAFNYYQNYARLSSFSVRKSTVKYDRFGVSTQKQYLCSQEGFNKKKKVDTLNDTAKQKASRISVSKRIGCKAELCVGFEFNMWYVKKFVEEHNHPFVDEEDMHFLVSSRKLTHLHKHIINSMSRMNVGPVRAFNMMREILGGFEEVGATREDFKNYRKKHNSSIGEYDAQMAVDHLMRKKEYMPNFSCEYITDDQNCLRGLFWADELGKKNYHIFGDVMSFDATYRSNKYSMVFVPFTGIDNHCSNVTFGAALLGSETTESYVWLLKCFLKAFIKQPQVVVTDQDPAMTKAIDLVFKESRHRFCMWHIMNKLSIKVGVRLCNCTDFKKDICNIVWTDAISPEEFDARWKEIIVVHKLEDNNWLHDIFGKRESWIPAYYKDELLSGLMRTTSRSESENHFFGQLCNPRSTLVEFLSHYETAMESQRHTHRKNDHDTRFTNPELKSLWWLEAEAAKIFTRTTFLDIQQEMDMMRKLMCQTYYPVEDDFMKYHIKDWTQMTSKPFEVMFRQSDMTIYCECRRFESFGLFCRHIFYVLRQMDIREFPKKYVLRRWRRDVVPNSSNRNDDTIYVQALDDGGRVLMRDIMYANEYILNKLSGNMAELSLYKEHVQSYMQKADNVDFVPPPPAKRDRFGELTGTSQNDRLPIRVPLGYKTKGSGSHKRIKSKQEEAIIKAGRKQKQCQNCLEFGHYSTTCPEPPQRNKGVETANEASVLSKTKKGKGAEAHPQSNTGGSSTRVLRSRVNKQ